MLKYLFLVGLGVSFENIIGWLVGGCLRRDVVRCICVNIWFIVDVNLVWW